MLDVLSTWEGWAGLSLLAVLVAYGFHPIDRWRLRHLPGPRPRWLIGNLHEYVAKGQEAAYAEWSQRYGPLFVYWFGGTPVVVVEDPAAARHVLRSIAKRKMPDVIATGEDRRWIHKHLIFLNGEAFRTTRNSWTPFFSRSSLENYATLMTASADRLAELLAPAAASGQVVDIWRMLGRMTLEVVGTTAFGVDFHTMDQGSKGGSAGARPAGGAKGVATAPERLLAAVRAVFENFGVASAMMGVILVFPQLSAPLRALAHVHPTKFRRQEIEARRVMRSITQELIDMYHAEGSSSASSADGTTTPARTAAGSSGVDPGSFLALLSRTVGRQAHKAQPRVLDTTTGDMVALDDSWAGSQAAMFILAGYETTANALAYTIYLLALHPDKEAALLREVDGLKGRTPSAADLERMPYAAACFKEALRLYPPATMSIRESKGEALLGYAIPAGTELHANIYSMQRSERYWKQPLAFLPERFIPGTAQAAEAESSMAAYMPFGEGARKCIGYAFAEQEGLLALVRLYQRFTFELEAGQVPLKVRTLITMGPAHGINVTVHPRVR